MTTVIIKNNSGCHDGNEDAKEKLACPGARWRPGLAPSCSRISRYFAIRRFVREKRRPERLLRATVRPSGFHHPLGAGRMPLVNGLVPSRFLTLTAHLVIVITIFWSRENNVRACLPLQYTQQDYEKKDTEMVVALSVTLGLFVVELAGFLSGVSMFNNLQGLLSTGAHASAAIALLFFLFEQWDGSRYWWIFAFCSALPAAVEVLLFVSVFGLKRKPL
ncbi:UNVERIFIED_CONTAM: hypothetical protein K2H54_042553 [Gekko kuhli]